MSERRELFARTPSQVAASTLKSNGSTQQGFWIRHADDGSQDAFCRWPSCAAPAMRMFAKGRRSPARSAPEQRVAGDQRVERRRQHGALIASGAGERRAPPRHDDRGCRQMVSSPKKATGSSLPTGGARTYRHITALRRSGVSALDPGQRVRVEVVDGKKGLEAERITLI